MIQSMTGFGKVTAELPTKRVTVEIKSLNSKQLDLSTRIAPIYRDREMAIRNEIAQSVLRGKVDCSVQVELMGRTTTAQLNRPAIEAYCEQIRSLSAELQLPLPADWFQTVLRLPEAVKSEPEEADENEWDTVLGAVRGAIEGLTAFRKQEGAMLQRLFEEKIATIGQLLRAVEPFEAERIERIRTRLADALGQLPDTSFDPNRLEQELIYYIEKLDVNEEKSRLANHLSYFMTTLDEAPGQGRKLGFIAQEIGREINTLGSKSNHAEMQQIVVRMKDELEQIKEQILNVL